VSEARIPVVVHGAEGRMGVLVTALVDGAEDLDLAGLVTEPGQGRPAGAFHPTLALLGQDEMAANLPRGCVIVDFSLAAALDGLLVQAAALGSPVVSGTTGFSADQQQKLTQHAGSLPVVHASNFSVGIPTLQMLLQLLARTLPRDFDAAQVETHHHTKLDRPSGTAKTLVAAYEAIRGGEPVPTASQRLGGVVGEHTWTFSDQTETLVLTHRAHSREAFLRGILPAVRFAAARSSGLYSLTDVLQDLGGRS
jgi:4-hydroxy-tetrahydrodipicolinate reductase